VSKIRHIYLPISFTPEILLALAGDLKAPFSSLVTTITQEAAISTATPAAKHKIEELPFE
jgi:hypothetical protein